MKSLIIVYSYHHMNTEKIARAMAKTLDAQVKTPQEVKPEELWEYDLTGFGSGIYGENFDTSMIELADKLSVVRDKMAFLFSTNGVPASMRSIINEKVMLEKNHKQMKEKLKSKGYVVVDEFSCTGFNTNSFLRYFGGVNKGRPDAEDLRRAEEFAGRLKQKV